MKLLNKKFIINLLLSALSVALSLGFVQLLLLPSVAKSMSSDNYGFMLTVIAIVDVFSVTFGTAICNTRLIKKEKYDQIGINGDYQIIALIYNCIVCVCSVVVSFIFGEKSVGLLALIGVFSCSVFYCSYSYVFFRLRRKFILELLTSAIMIAGYLLGYILFRFTGIWVFIFILGYSFGFCFAGLFYGKIYREKMIRTELFRATNINTIQLGSSTMLKEVVTYADKFVLYPLMGGTTVAVYHSASIVGKFVALITNPLNGLILSHLSLDHDKNKKYFTFSLIIGTILCFCFYWICLLVSRPIINLLYPQFCDDAMKIVAITLISAMIEALIAMLNPFVLKMYNSKLQIIVNLSSLITYLGLAFLFYHFYGLVGFCFAVVAASFIKLLCLLGLVIFCETKKNEWINM